ncbi:MAG: Asp-tRNA(Asn)/Glu-tRNA(Gln) amidotransferase subunit GatC [Candidatus Woesearchaeota archaeon]
MNIDKDLIKKVAKNARLNLTESEIKEFLPQLKEILNSFSVINDVNTDNIKPSFQPIEIKNVYREDKVEKSLTQREALANTKHKKDGFFKGPKAI